ncbi:MAG: hypothetical protein ACJ76V_04955 [Thermoleophilaceae bacterium]
MQSTQLLSYVASAQQADIARHARDAQRKRIPEPARKPAREPRLRNWRPAFS